MILTRLILVALLSWSAVSCTTNSADLKYPTVAEADAADEAWGMTRRKPRGGPKQMFPAYKSSDAGGMNAAPSQPAAAPARPAAVAAPAPVIAPVAPSPAVVAPPSIR